MKHPSLKKSNCRHLHFLLLPTLLLTQIAVVAHSGAGASTFESQAIGQGPQTIDVREIKPGQVIEGRLNGGESHTYTVALKAGEYMKALDHYKQAGRTLSSDAADASATIVAVPLVTSIVAPTAAQASTCKPSGQPCASGAQCCSGLCNSNLCA